MKRGDFVKIKEIWKDIPNYEKKYQISNLGNIKTLNYKGTKKEKILKQQIDKDGYKYIVLHKNGKIKYYMIHRLVALVFIPNYNNLLQINHKDANEFICLSRMF